MFVAGSFAERILFAPVSALLKTLPAGWEAAKATAKIARGKTAREVLSEAQGVLGKAGAIAGLPLGYVGRAMGLSSGRIRQALTRGSEIAAETALREAKETALAVEGLWDVGKRLFTTPGTPPGRGEFIGFRTQVRPWVRESAIPVALVGGAAFGTAGAAMSPSPQMPWDDAMTLPGVLTPSTPRGLRDDLGATGDLVFALNNMR